MNTPYNPIGCKFNPYCPGCREVTKKFKFKAGFNVERKLVSKAWQKGMVAIRFAGSGSGTSYYPKSDVILFTKGKIFIIEFKTSRPNQLPVRYYWKDLTRNISSGFFKAYEIAQSLYQNGFQDVNPLLRFIIFIPCKKNNLSIDVPIKKDKDIMFNFRNWENLEKGIDHKKLELYYEYKDNYWTLKPINEKEIEDIKPINENNPSLFQTDLKEER